MANPNAGFGFKPLRSLSGGEVTINYYRLISSATRIFKGDLVKFKNDGTVTRETSATAVGPWLGVAMKDSGVVTSAQEKFPVCDDPNAIYEVQSKSTAAIAVTALNLIYKVDCSPAGSTDYGQSKNVLTTTAATASNGVRLLRIIDDVSNESGAYQRVEVKINAHEQANAQAGV